MKIIDLPPLSLYIHYPWCIKKCPYCDFNSHQQQGNNDLAYVKAVLNNLENSLHYIQDREIETIFIGGGTPSLCSVEAMAFLFTGLKQKLKFAQNIEITLEANPGASDIEKLSAFRKIGINRLSIGVQSFEDKFLKALGRVHSGVEAIEAIKKAQQIGFNNFNIDLMFGLENQSVEECLSDVKKAISLNPTHLSFYQLTIEPNTLFAKNPPKLSNENAWLMQQSGHELLENMGFKQYEISAFAKVDKQAKHNLNYWQFGDYLGIGAGAHGKITIDDKIIRTTQLKSPKDFINNNQEKTISVDNIAFEFMLNALRLKQGFNIELFKRRTGLNIIDIQKSLNKAFQLDLLEQKKGVIKTTTHGYNFLNDCQGLFL
jgi:oxygen-independent coproporphyrinogen-3 oxidase